MTTTPGLGPLDSGRAMKPPPLRIEGSTSRVCIDQASYPGKARACREGDEPAVSSTSPATWARGAVGSASEWHSEGQGFESPRVHQIFEFRFGACSTCQPLARADTLSDTPLSVYRCPYLRVQMWLLASLL